MSATLLPILALLILFIGLPWLVLHYVTKMQKARSLNPADERMLEDLWLIAREMRRRIETVEDILEIKKDKKTKDNDNE